MKKSSIVIKFLIFYEEISRSAIISSDFDIDVEKHVEAFLYRNMEKYCIFTRFYIFVLELGKAAIFSSEFDFFM